MKPTVLGRFSVFPAHGAVDGGRRLKIGRRLIGGAMAVLLAAVLIMSMAGTVVADASTTRWYLCDNGHYSIASDVAKPQYIMSQNILLSEGDIAIQEGQSIVWIADETALVDIFFPKGDWTGNLAIYVGPGACLVEIGKRSTDGALSFYGNVPVVFAGASSIDNPIVVSVSAFDLASGERLACRITTTSRHTLLHSGSSPDACGQSWIQTTGEEPPPPVPDLPTLVLLGAGLASVASVVGLSMLRHRSPAY